VLGYRAPTWSITARSMWALDILLEEGFLYDSSIFPVHHDLYGVPGAPRTPYTARSGPGGRLIEFPPATVQCGGATLPSAGGGYLRILPFWYTTWALRAFERETSAFVIYFHPWEIDPEQPRIRGRWKSRFRHYTNLGGMEARLRRLIAMRPFRPFRDALPDYNGGHE
jgi:polysaccharide deacetylase family protein (PEP-CTERM system associated)